MFKAHRRNNSIQLHIPQKQLFPKHKSVSIPKKKEKPKGQRDLLHQGCPKPSTYYIMETDPALAPAISKQMFRSKYLSKHHEPKLKIQHPKRHTKSKSSTSKKKQSKSKSKSKQSKEKKEVFGKLEKSSGERAKGTKVRSQSKNGKQPSTNEFSIDKLSKTYRASHERSKNQQNKKQQCRGTQWEEIIQLYGEYLTVEEIAEIKEIKVIYFLGKIAQRKSKQLFRMDKNKSESARKPEHWQQTEQQDLITVKPLFSERKQERMEDRQISLSQQQLASDFYEYQLGDHIGYRYELIESINRGAFGEVIKVYDHKHREFLALKIVKKSSDLIPQTLVEISILTQIAEKDKEGLSGIVKIKDFTIFRKHICIVFELLQNNLYELMAANHFQGFPEEQVRIFAIQLLNSLHFMRKLKVIHCDIKPENIVLTKWGKSGLKIIDFGTSCLEGKQLYEYLQSRYYRSPQIILGTKYSFPIDMWSLGCLLAELRLGEPLFAASTDIEHLMYIANMIGLPKKEDGAASEQFLASEQMRELIEQDYLGKYHSLSEKEEARSHPLFSKFKHIQRSMLSLHDRMKELENSSEGFLKFILKMLAWEPDKRIKPQEALEDPWIIGGLPKNIKKIYLKISNTERHHSNSKSTSKEKGKRKGSSSPSSKLCRSKSKKLSKGKDKKDEALNQHAHPSPLRYSREQKRKKGSIPLARNEYVRSKLKGV